jgi:hypothetical protein
VTPAEFERIAARLAIAEDALHALLSAAQLGNTELIVRRTLQDAYSAVIAAHAAAQLALEEDGEDKPCAHPADERSASVELGMAYCTACGAEVDSYT